MEKNNEIKLIGNLGKDPEIKTVGEKTLVKFSMATNEKWNDKAGVEQTETSWHSIEAWGKVAEIAKSFKSGDFVKLSGKLTYNIFDNKDGQKVKDPIITCTFIEKAIKTAEVIS